MKRRALSWFMAAALGVGTIITIYGLVRKEDNKKVIGTKECMER